VSDAGDERETQGYDASTRHVALAITALALGGFAIGTTEFVTMGLLPEIAHGIGQSIPRTGHVITAYALGVVVGAPVIVALGARLPRRELAVGLVLALGLGNAATAMAHGYWPVMAARFLAGLPHGAYFGVASLIAASLVSADRKGRAVSGVMLGLSVATVVGVPASTWLGQQLGWRSAYWAVVAIVVVTAGLLLVAVPHTRGNRAPSATITGAPTTTPSAYAVMTWPVLGIEESMPRAISGSRPIVTNSVVPIAKPPSARAVIASTTCRARTGLSSGAGTSGEVIRRRVHSSGVPAV
jgi:predicted MFS family arabinose efflux permease